MSGARFDSTLSLLALPPAQLAAMRSGKQLFTLLEPLAYVSPTFGAIVVPAGTVSDFASVPGIVKGYLDDDAPAILYASIVHDYLYGVGGALPDGRTFTRQQADAILREAMIASGARTTQAALVYAAVRAFGWRNWVAVTPK